MISAVSGLGALQFPGAVVGMNTAPATPLFPLATIVLPFFTIPLESVMSAFTPTRVQLKFATEVPVPVTVPDSWMPLIVKVPRAKPFTGSGPMHVSEYVAAFAVSVSFAMTPLYRCPFVRVPVMNPVDLPLHVTDGPLLVGHTGNLTVQLNSAVPVILALAGTIVATSAPTSSPISVTRNKFLFTSLPPLRGCLRGSVSKRVERRGLTPSRRGLTFRRYAPKRSSPLSQAKVLQKRKFERTLGLLFCLLTRTSGGLSRQPLEDQARNT